MTSELTGELTGTLAGTLTGRLTGRLTSELTGELTGILTGILAYWMVWEKGDLCMAKCDRLTVNLSPLPHTNGPKPIHRLTVKLSLLAHPVDGLTAQPSF